MVDTIAGLIVRDVAELPDRSSPDGQPEMMLVTADELSRIITDRLAALSASGVVVPERLTAENGAKAALSGEFSERETIRCHDCDDGDVEGEPCDTCDGSGELHMDVPISWTTIKAIHCAVVAHFAAAPKPVNPGLDSYPSGLESNPAPKVSEAVQWDAGSPCVHPRPVGMVYPDKPVPRASGYLDDSGVEWNAYDTVQMEAYARRAVADYPMPQGVVTAEWQQAYDAGFSDGRYVEQKIADQDATLYCSPVQNELQIIPGSITEQADPAPSVAGEVIAWLCVSEDGSSRDAAESSRKRDTYANMGRTITPLCDARIVAERNGEIDRLLFDLGRYVKQTRAAEARADALAGVLRECVDNRHGLGYEAELLARIDTLLSEAGK